jgi:hypothetical protein
MLFLSVGGLIHHMLNGGTKATNAWRKQAAITHGIGIVLILLGGFGRGLSRNLKAVLT